MSKEAAELVDAITELATRLSDEWCGKSDEETRNLDFNAIYNEQAAALIDAAFAKVREDAIQTTAATAVHEILCNWMAHDEDDPCDARYIEHHTKHLVPTIVIASRAAILGTEAKD